MHKIGRLLALGGNSICGLVVFCNWIWWSWKMSIRKMGICVKLVASILAFLYPFNMVVMLIDLVVSQKESKASPSYRIYWLTTRPSNQRWQRRWGKKKDTPRPLDLQRAQRIEDNGRGGGGGGGEIIDAASYQLTTRPRKWWWKWR